jgi:hypothetical protein
MTRRSAEPTMLAMIHDRPDESSSSDPQITQRTTAKYREDLIAELEADNRRLRERTDTLQRWLNERTSELRAFGTVASMRWFDRRGGWLPTMRPGESSGHMPKCPPSRSSGLDVA